MGSSTLRPFLQSLCRNSPWNYAVFWKLKHQYEMILVLEDGFWEIPNEGNSKVHPLEGFYLEKSTDMLSSTVSSSVLDGTLGEFPFGLAGTQMSSDTHVVGQGVVCEASLTGKAHWIYCDNIMSSSGLVPQYPDEWLLQFAAGIKTVLVLPVIPHGVLQLGSMKMVPEDTALVAHLTEKFEAHINSEYEWGYSIQQFNLMSSFMENLEESSPISTEKENENQEDTHATEKHCDLFDYPTIPVLRVQDSDNSFVGEGIYENAFDSEVSWQSLGMFRVAETFQQSFENTDSIFKPFNLDVKVSTFSNSDNSLWTSYGDFVNELMDFHSEEDYFEPHFLAHDFFNTGSSFFSSHQDSELHKALVPNALGDTKQDYNPFYSVDTSELESARFPIIEDELKHLLEDVFANACNTDDNSSDKSNLTSFNMPSSENKCSPSGEEDSVPMSFFTSEFITQEINIPSHMPAPVSSVESDITTLVENRKKRRKSRDPLDAIKVSRVSTINKKRVCGDNQKSRPRDRQLIQDRIKELRDLIPNSEKSSIDGLLDRTIKHMVFLRSVTDRADKLRLQSVKEEAGEKITKTAKNNDCHHNGRSWAVELGSEQQICPIVVKDLDHPGHMIIEMLCTDHDRFLEIADVIHRLQLKMLKGAMEEKSDNSWARFIVQASGSFHRLDIFWPLMQFL